MNSELVDKINELPDSYSFFVINDYGNSCGSFYIVDLKAFAASHRELEQRLKALERIAEEMPILPIADALKLAANG